MVPSESRARAHSAWTADRNTDPSIRQARKVKVLVDVPTPPPRLFRNDIIPKEFHPINVQEYHSKEVRSAATRANKQEAMTVAESQFGANLKLGATFGSAKFEHVPFYLTSKQPIQRGPPCQPRIGDERVTAVRGRRRSRRFRRRRWRRR